MPKDETFSEDQQAMLSGFLDEAATQGALSFPESAGFLFAAAAAPEAPPPREWLTHVLGEADFADERQGNAVTAALNGLHDWIAGRALAGASPLPAGCEPEHGAAANIGEDAPLGQWSRGFTFGHRWLENAWRNRVPDDLVAEYGAAVLAMSFFSSRKVAEACRKQARAMESVDDMATHMLEMLPRAQGMYFNLGRAIRLALDELAPVPRPHDDGGDRRH